MKLFLKILLGLVAVVLLFAAFIQFAPPRTFDVSLPEVTLSTDSAVLARGEYLVFGPAHCSGCHSRKQDGEALDRGEIVPLAGGKFFETEIGKIYMPNITPDPETGIGNLSDGQLSRAIRFAINRDGHAMVPAMPFTYMSESDVSAIISYLRAQEPVVNEVPRTTYNFMGKAVSRFLLKPYPQTEPIPQHVEPGPTLEYGAYLTNSVANCRGCHTTFDINTMSYNGVPFTGGSEMSEETHIFRTPNLTPDPKTGHMTDWTEAQFVSRFKAGKVYPDSPMPWGGFSRMSEDDSRAIFQYLRTLEPYENEVGEIARKK